MPDSYPKKKTVSRIDTLTSRTRWHFYFIAWNNVKRMTNWDANQFVSYSSQRVAIASFTYSFAFQLSFVVTRCICRSLAS